MLSGRSILQCQKNCSSASGEAAVFKAGGVDLLDMVKEGIIQPMKIVNIRNIPGLDGISFDRNKGLKLGANVTLAEIEGEEIIRKNYLALHQAVTHAATPQLRNMSTLGGNMAQRNRCWYFRSADHPCFRKGGDRCYARHSTTGQNENHAIMNNGLLRQRACILRINCTFGIRCPSGNRQIVKVSDGKFQ